MTKKMTVRFQCTYRSISPEQVVDLSVYFNALAMIAQRLDYPDLVVSSLAGQAQNLLCAYEQMQQKYSELARLGL